MTKIKMPLNKAQLVADNFVELLRPKCVRIEVAGSIRRLKPEVGDIEIVCIPNMIKDTDMFGNAIGERNEIETDYFLHYLHSQHRIECIKGGGKYRQFYDHNNNMYIDLFMVTPPAQWGYIFALRTGSGEWNRKLVTQRRYGGGLPTFMKLQEGGLYIKGTLIETPEEEDFFRAIGVAWVDPQRRNPEAMVLVEPQYELGS